MRGICLAWLSVCLLLPTACGNDDIKEGSGTDNGSGSDGTDGGSGTDGATTTTTTAGSNSGGGSPVCEGVDCGGFGDCVEVDSRPRCVCEAGYVEDPNVPTCVPEGSTTTTAGTTGATTDTSAGTTGNTSVTTTTTDSGGGKPDGEPCELPDECQGGYCYSSYMEPGGISETKCFSECIGQQVFELWCFEDADCCEGTCSNDGYCVNGGGGSCADYMYPMQCYNAGCEWNWQTDTCG